MHSTPTIDRLLDRRTVAVVGASRDGGQIANAILRRLRDGGRTVYAVNPRAGDDEIEGAPTVASVSDLPPGVEAVFVVVPAPAVPGVVREALDAGIRSIWIHRGIGGPAASPEAIGMARAVRADMVAGECPLMFLEPVTGFHRIHRRFRRQVTAA